MDFDVESLNVADVEASLNKIDITNLNLDYDSIYSETNSNNYSTVKPFEMINPLDLKEIDSIKVDSKNKTFRRK